MAAKDDSSDFEPSTVPEQDGAWPRSVLESPSPPPHAVPLVRAPQEVPGPETHPGPPSERPEESTPSTRSLSAVSLAAAGQRRSSLDLLLPPDSGEGAGDSSRTMLSSPDLGSRPAHTTLQSVARPGPPPSQSWDERRIIHIEREVDQLVARTKLTNKRQKALERQLRWLWMGLVALTCLELLRWWFEPR